MKTMRHHKRGWRPAKIATLAVLIPIMLSGFIGQGPGAADLRTPQSRFFYSGDGRIDLYGRKNAKRFNGVYRHGDTYDPRAVAAICRVFDASDDRKLSLRLIEFIDFLQDHLAPGAPVTITSGYRDPEYNTALRDKGRLAAKASLHQYGMAADLIIKGVQPRKLWDYVKALGFGGTGFYKGESVHIDVGPARFWDQQTSGVGTGISDDNKLIGIVTDFDIYRPGQSQQLRFIRMTAFPIGVNPNFFLEHLNDRPDHPGRDGSASTVVTFTPARPAVAEKSHECRDYHDIEEMSGLIWQLPDDLAPGRYQVRARFCGTFWEHMPAEVLTPVFEIVSGQKG